MRRPAGTILAGLVLFLSASASFAAEEWRTNTRVLPPYCKDRLDPWGPGWSKWRDHFGKVHIHMSHYCNGLYAEIKAKQTFEKRERDRWLASVVGEMAYVSRDCHRDCIIFAELHRRWAWALTQQGKVAEAMTHIQLASTARAEVQPQPNVRPPQASQK